MYPSDKDTYILFSDNDNTSNNNNNNDNFIDPYGHELQEILCSPWIF